ncbi:protein APEM9-like [Chenopodium quinoa]|uniref:protein APEM9-like n=1 Tax=Chenopodium quinoa TaxID=63459 RepID=UPI000B794C8C|nr:protein APEM9-like [Chenopodium quinoa]
MEEEVVPARMPLDFVTWQQIDLAESYLVSGMFEKAAASASSILTRLHDNRHIYTEDDVIWHEMMESSAMVLVQSWRETGRSSDLLKELEGYFGSVCEIPVQVVLTGACVQVSGGHPSRVRDFLEDFLSKWQLNNDKYYAVASPNVQKIDVDVSAGHFTIEGDQFIKVVEVYALTLLGVALNNVDHAISWVEKAQLPENARQDLLRRLHSLSHLKSSSSTLGDVSVSTVEEPESHALSLKEVKQSDKTMTVLSTQGHNGGVDSKHPFWISLQNITQRSCNSVIASRRKIFLACLIFVISYFIQKKRESIKRGVLSRVLSLKQTLVDFWKLAFSYQVNPLAAVQPLPASTNRSR